MNTELLVYRPGRQSADVVSRDLPKEPSLDDLKRAVLPLLGADCWNLEHVCVLFEGRFSDMFLDESSAIDRHGRPPLPVNEAATAIYHAASRRRGYDMTDAPKIRGPAVVARRRVWY